MRVYIYTYIHIYIYVCVLCIHAVWHVHTISYENTAWGWWRMTPQNFGIGCNHQLSTLLSFLARGPRAWQMSFPSLEIFKHRVLVPRFSFRIFLHKMNVYIYICIICKHIYIYTLVNIYIYICTIQYTDRVCVFVCECLSSYRLRDGSFIRFPHNRDISIDSRAWWMSHALEMSDDARRGVFPTLFLGPFASICIYDFWTYVSRDISYLLWQSASEIDR